MTTASIAVQLRRAVVEKRRDTGGDQAGDDKPVKPAPKLPALYRPIYIDEAHARFAHAVGTERPFLERLTQFWTNHFAVSIDKIVVLGLAGAFEREAIRPNVTGNFTGLLLAVEKHPAMLLYLDNQTSIGPHSRAAQFVAHRSRRKLDINENLAREILELHTLGVNGGYTQADVTEFARVLTGWTARPMMNAPGGGAAGFAFVAARHEPGARTLLGKTYAEDGMAQGEAVLRDLAAHPATAQFVATKLARHFIADEPPPEAVARIARAFRDSDGHLPTVYGALLADASRYYVFDAIAMRDRSFELGDGPGYKEDPVTPGTRERGLKVIRETVSAISSFYRFPTSPGSAP
jgi:uncharacterized protein (DUF1800 family)